MGFYDEITMDHEDAGLGISRGDTFQTKSLYAGGGQFTITSEGKLVEHCSRFEPDKNPLRKSPFSRHERVSLGIKVIEYHGDILLHGNRTDARFNQLVARFTQGILVQILPLEKYPEANLMILLEQGAR